MTLGTYEMYLVWNKQTKRRLIYITWGIMLNQSCFFQAHYYPQTITETILFDLVPEIGLSKQKNVLERLWAYLTIQDLLKRVARYQINNYWIPRQTLALIGPTKKSQNNSWNSG